MGNRCTIERLRIVGRAEFVLDAFESGCGQIEGVCERVVDMNRVKPPMAIGVVECLDAGNDHSAMRRRPAKRRISIKPMVEIDVKPAVKCKDGKIRRRRFSSERGSEGARHQRSGATGYERTTTERSERHSMTLCAACRSVLFERSAMRQASTRNAGKT